MEFWPHPKDSSPVETGQEDLGWRVVQSLSKRNGPGGDVRLKRTEQHIWNDLRERHLHLLISLNKY